MKDKLPFHPIILKSINPIMATNRKEKETTNEIYVEDERMCHRSIYVNNLTNYVSHSF